MSLAKTSFDDAGQVSNLHHKNGSGTNIANYTYSYDNVGSPLSEQRNGTTTSFGYDTTNQLTTDGTHTFGFDGTGNRTFSYDGTTTAIYATTGREKVSGPNVIKLRRNRRRRAGLG